MLKDLINVYQKIEVLRMPCPSCKSFRHTIERCPLLNYKPNEGIVIERFKKENNQNRKKRFRAPKKMNARALKQKVEMASELLEFDFPDPSENCLEDDLLSYHYDKNLQKIDMVNSRIVNSDDYQEGDGEALLENKADEKNGKNLMESSNSECRNQKQKKKNSGQVFENVGNRRISTPLKKNSCTEVKINHSTILMTIPVIERTNPIIEKASPLLEKMSPSIEKSKAPLGTTSTENYQKKLLSE